MNVTTTTTTSATEAPTFHPPPSPWLGAAFVFLAGVLAFFVYWCSRRLGSWHQRDLGRSIEISEDDDDDEDGSSKEERLDQRPRQQKEGTGLKRMFY